MPGDKNSHPHPLNDDGERVARGSDQGGRAVGVTVERRGRSEDSGPERDQGTEKPVLYRGKVVRGDGNIVELGDGRRSVPKTMNDTGNAAGYGIDMEEEEVIGIFCGMILPGIGNDDPLPFEGDAKRVEVAL